MVKMKEFRGSGGGLVSLPTVAYANAHGRLSSCVCLQISDDDVSSDDDSWIAVKVQWSSKQDDDEGTRASQ